MRQIRDQALHLLFGAVVLLPVAAAPGWLTFTVSGAAIGAVREITEKGSPFTAGSLLDVTFWAFGGLTCWAVFAA